MFGLSVWTKCKRLSVWTKCKTGSRLTRADDESGLRVGSYLNLSRRSPEGEGGSSTAIVARYRSPKRLENGGERRIRRNPLISIKLTRQDLRTFDRTDLEQGI